MLTIQQIFDRVLLRSGQFILRQKNVEIDVDNFRFLVEDALELYNDAHPYDEEVDIDFRSNRNFIFQDDYGDLNRPPDWIAEAHPVSGFYGIHLHQNINSHYGSGYNNHNVQYTSDVLSDPVQSPWLFNEKTKTLTVSHADQFKVTLVYFHQIEQIDLGGGELEWCISTVSARDQLLLQLIQGKFLKGVGRSRRAFTLNDLPILMDSQELVSEGKELEDEAIEKLNNVQKFRLGIG